jgi:hypothetical protein
MFIIINYRNLRLNKALLYKDPEQVIEIKVPANFEDDLIEKLIPYPTSRFTKYSRGILISQRQLSEV